MRGQNLREEVTTEAPMKYNPSTKKQKRGRRKKTGKKGIIGGGTDFVTETKRTYSIQHERGGVWGGSSKTKSSHGKKAAG